MAIFISFRIIKMGIKNLFLGLLAVLLSLGISAQSIDKENSSANEFNTFYNQHIGKASILYSGSAYITMQLPMTGNPFFGGDTLCPGWIRYDGQLYNEVFIQWDVLQNYVLTQSLVSEAKLILRNELIDSFSFAGHLVKFMAGDRENNLMQEGLYDILYEGYTTLMVRRKKVGRQKIEMNVPIYQISVKDLYYIRKKGIYYQVDNKKDVARLYGKEMGEIKKIVRRNKLKWKKDLEQILLLAVVSFDKATAT